MMAYFYPGLIRQRWEEHLSGKRNWQFHLWDILMFQAWLDGQRGLTGVFSYWFMYAIPSMAAVMGKERRTHALFPFLVVSALFAVFIGFVTRWEGIGGNILSYLKSMRGQSLIEVLTTYDPGYAALNWLMYRWDWGIYGVNTVCAIIFLTGLMVCCRQQTRPWLGFAVAFPYLIVVMAMGYTRQGVALGLFFLAIASMERGHFKRYLLFITAGRVFP